MSLKVQFAIGFFSVIVLMAIILKRSKILKFLNKTFTRSKKELLENALKFIYDCEYKQIDCTFNSLAGHLGISADRTVGFVALIESLNLISSGNDHIKLTGEGRSYALRIIRVHRIWERYLADETEMKEIDWHGSAEEVEHEMTFEEANILAKKLGNPVYDPHGDPIPTPEGFLPPHKGLPLNNLTEGQFGRIIHIEDEPQAIYLQICAIGLKPGQQIQVIESSSNRLKFERQGEEFILAPIFAANVTVEITQFYENTRTKNIALSTLSQGESAIVAGISKECRGQQRRRLMDFGIVPGSEITLELTSTFGDPKAFMVRGALVALREQQINQIFIKNKLINT